MMDNGKTGKTGKSRVDLKTIIITSAFALLVGIAATLFTTKITQKTTGLEYDITSSRPFKGPTETIAIATLTVYNTGDLIVEDLRCRMKLDVSTIRDKVIGGLPDTSLTVTSGEGSIEVRAPYFNPGEQLDIEVLYSPTVPVRITPKVTVRGKGITGQIREPDDGFSLWVLLLVVVVSGTLGSALSSWFGFEDSGGLLGAIERLFSKSSETK